MEAILSEASTSLRDRGPPVPGPFFAFDIGTSAFLHREMGGSWRLLSWGCRGRGGPLPWGSKLFKTRGGFGRVS